VLIVLKNLGASTSWNPQGLSRLVMGLLFTVEDTKLQYSSAWVNRIWKFHFIQVAMLEISLKHVSPYTFVKFGKTVRNSHTTILTTN
jgi:hypothetical protein